ncbi:MAG TPA: DUF4407 domain-containing protein [Saprospiraceae bacterium]|nr:DUF4407 domain-containing protein [Saprospiraceae bacterium]
MERIQRFFLFCSGVHPSVLKRCPTDYNKYTGIGATIFFTGVLAFIAAGYAIYTVFQSWLPALVFGLVWGLMIFNLDRYIVSSMKRRGNGFKDFLVALPRIAFAVLIALVISKPLELKIFDREIQAELVSMRQEVRKDQEDKVKARYTGDSEKLQTEITNLKSEEEAKRAHRDELAMAAQQEADGTGGSKQRNLGPIYQVKRADADRAEQEYQDVLARNEPMIRDKEAQLQSLQTALQADVSGLEDTPFNGFAARLEALSRLASRSEAIWIASLFIMLLFIAIETAPIFVKLISSRSPYDLVLHEHEHQFEMHHSRQTTLLKNTIQRDIEFDQHTGSYRTQAAIRAEKQLIDQALTEEVEKIRQAPLSWREMLRKGLMMNQ